MEKREGDSLIYYQSSLLGSKKLKHGFFSRKGGVSTAPFASLNCSYSVSDNPLNVHRNITRVCQTLDIKSNALITCQIEHGDSILKVDSANQQDLYNLMNKDKSKLPFADAIITNLRDCALYFNSADCAIAIIYDPTHHAIGLVHCGWKGIVKKVFSKTIALMSEYFGSSPESLIVAVSASIGSCCYQIKNPIQHQYKEWRPYLQLLGNGITAIDLRSALHDQIIETNILDTRLDEHDLCTACHTELFFSFWAEKPMTGRMTSIVSL
jgi:YfiH family protein